MFIRIVVSVCKNVIWVSGIWAQASISSLFATNGFISSVFRNLSCSAKTREGAYSAYSRVGAYCKLENFAWGHIRVGPKSRIYGIQKFQTKLAETQVS